MKIFPLIIILSFALSFASAREKTYNIVDFGAKADGTTNNTQAIQTAINKAYANGGGMVLVPKGNFVTGVIYLKSNINLHLAAGAHLLATTNRADYGPKKASALIRAEDAHHLSITGKGTIDGQAELLLKDIYRMLNNGTLEDAEWKTYNDWHQMRPAEDNRPHLIEFKNCTDIQLKNYTIKNGLCWIQTYRDCNNMVIDSIHVESNTFLNNDGIDLVDCKKVKLSNSSFNVADDGICLKSSNPKSSCEDIDISNCKIRSSASAFKLGTASLGGFKRIKVRNLYVYDTFRSAIAIETVDGGDIDGIDIRDVVAKNTGNAIFIRLGKRKKDAEPGILRNVYIGNVKAEIPLGKPDAGYSMEGPPELFSHNIFPASITGIPGHNAQHITLANIEITYAGGAKKEKAWFAADSLTKIPEKSGAYPEFSMFGELPAWAFYVRHAQDIVMKNIKFNYQQSDARTACIFDDVAGLQLYNIAIQKSATEPVIILNNVKRPQLKHISVPGDLKKAVKYTGM
jgi:polygalacturonase